jgi:glycosyltransferase involved in cell wall biosynthesis
MPALSVLMPCYNATDTIVEVLENLAEQTFVDYEIVAVEDGSQDNTGEILDAWAKQDQRLRVIRQSHQGIVQALNRGLRECQGGLIARMDADDVCLPERFEQQVTWMQDHPETTVAGSLVESYSQEGVSEGFAIYLEWLNSLVRNADIRREIFVESPLAHPSVIMRRSELEALGGYQEHGWPEDYDLWLRYYQAGAIFNKVPEVLLRWREHPGQLSRKDKRYSLENFLRLKACYLSATILKGKDGVIIWGAGMTGRRVSKHLVRRGIMLQAFLDTDSKKIGKFQRGIPIIASELLPELWKRFDSPTLLVAVGARTARPLIRAKLLAYQLEEEKDWWFIA